MHHCIQRGHARYFGASTANTQKAVHDAALAYDMQARQWGVLCGEVSHIPQNTHTKTHRSSPTQVKDKAPPPPSRAQVRPRRVLCAEPPLQHTKMYPQNKVRRAPPPPPPPPPSLPRVGEAVVDVVGGSYTM